MRWLATFAVSAVLMLTAEWLHARQTDDAETAGRLLETAHRGNIMHDSSRVHFMALLDYASRHKLIYYEGQAHYFLGRHHSINRRYPEAVGHFTRSMKVFHLLGETEQQGHAMERLANAYLRMEMLDSAMYHASNLVKHYQQYKLPHKLWSPYHSLSQIYQSLGQDAEALHYAQLALSSLSEDTDRVTKVVVLLRLTGLALALDSLSLHAQYSEQLIRLYSPVEIANDQLRHVPFYAGITDPKERFETILKYNDSIDSLITPSLYVNNFYTIGWYYREDGRWPEAISAWHNALRFEQKMQGMTRHRLLLLKSLSEGYEHTGDLTAALSFHRQYVTLKDSLTELHNRDKIEELRIQYETEAKDLALAQQTEELSRKTTQRNVIFGATLFLLGVILYISYSQIRQKRARRTIARQQSLLHQKELEDLRQQHTLDTLNTLITSQEDERRRIAQDLHDGLGGLLANVSIRAQQILRRPEGSPIRAEMQDLLNVLDNIGAETRRIAHHMMPHALIKMGLVVALEDLAASLQTLGNMKISFQSINCEEPFDLDKEIALYRITQELCTNAMKHARAQHLIIQLSRHNGTATLVVEDDGIGFEITGEYDGMGLNSVASRVTYLSGEMDLVSAHGEGTSVNIQFPVT